MIEWSRKLFYVKVRMYSVILEEKYECNAATIHGNADTIVKKVFELRTAVEIS